MRELRLVDLDLPCDEPILEHVKMNLKILRGNSWVRMDRKQPSVTHESGDGGVIGCGEIGSKY
jgi:transketolase C-terminal domain/subunit